MKCTLHFACFCWQVYFLGPWALMISISLSLQISWVYSTNHSLSIWNTVLKSKHEKQSLWVPFWRRQVWPVEHGLHSSCVETYAKVLWSNCNIFFFGNSQSGKEGKKKDLCMVYSSSVGGYIILIFKKTKNKTKTICFLRVVIVISELKHDKLSEASDQTINAQPNCG